MVGPVCGRRVIAPDARDLNIKNRLLTGEKPWAPFPVKGASRSNPRPHDRGVAPFLQILSAVGIPGELRKGSAGLGSQSVLGIRSIAQPCRWHSSPNRSRHENGRLA